MANEQNLIPFTSDQNREEAKKNGKKGGVASGKARRAKADLRKLMQMALDENIPGKDLTHAQRLVQSTLNIAENPKNGSSAVRAFETILRMIGQDMPATDADALNAARELLGGVDSVIDREAD